MKSIRNRLNFVAISLVASLVVGGTASAADAPAVEWKVSDGGNGHWYALSTDASIHSFIQRQEDAESKGAHLCTLSSITEHQFVFDLTLAQGGFTNGDWPALGGYRLPGTDQWKWITNEPFTYAPWGPTEPNGNLASGAYLQMWGANNQPNMTLDDNTNSTSDGGIGINPRVILEWSVDCNVDGIVDYGQIQSGELADTNHNNIPDVCDPHVIYVQPISGPASGGTAVNINGVNFPNSVSVLFGGVAATDVVVVSPTLITAVTPVGVPGMTVVTVNGLGGEAFYYRPSCGSDLDNNGVVDSADLGIVLGDFGNCYESLATPQEQEPFILQSVETAIPVLNKK